MKKASLIDLPVAIVFFVRPDTLKQVFEQVKIARPSKLFLIQDGPRPEHKNDIYKINQCREIVENVDWECEVYKIFQETNKGCFLGPYIGISEAFNYVERLMVLEDDVIPTQTYFQFCKEMLDKYEKDQRIVRITGFNHLENNKECTDSYFFAKLTASMTWASWKRCWNQIIITGEELYDDRIVDLISMDLYDKKVQKRYKREIIKNRNNIKNGITSDWIFHWGLIKSLYSGLGIIPKYNMVTNIGIGDDASFSGSSYKLLSARTKRFFFQKRYDIEFPLQHPKFVISDKIYESRVYRLLYPNWFYLQGERIIRLLKRIIYKVVDK